MKRFAALGLMLFMIFTGSQEASAQWSLRSNGYWYNGNSTTPHTRTTVTSNGYYSGGCWYPGTLSYQYNPLAPPPQAYAPPAVPQISYKDADWKSKLLDLAIARDKGEAKVRADAFEHQYFMEAVNGLGLAGNFRIQGYGMPAPYSGGMYAQQQGSYGGYGGMAGLPYQLNGHYYQNTVPINGTTLFGYNQQTYNAQSYQQGQTPLDLNLLNQQIFQNVQGINGSLDKAFSGQLAIAGQANNNQAKVNEMFARIEGIKQIGLLLQGPAEQKGYKFTISPAGSYSKDSTNVAPAAKLDILKAWAQHASAKCGVCHSGSRIEGNFDLNTYLDMGDAEKQQRVLPRLLPTASDKVRMPRSGDGSAGIPITVQEYQLWGLVEKPEKQMPYTTDK